MHAASHREAKCGASVRRCAVELLPPAAMLARSGLGDSLWDCVLHESRSQHGEERMLLPSLIAAAGGVPGSFVELGALDGLTYSNTVALERCFNWTGLLIEANPTNFARLQRSGRRATMVHSAVCAERGMLNISARAGATSRVGENGVGVPCAPLPTLMAEAGLNDGATFLSLDVEGSEAFVLATIPDIGATFSYAVVEGISANKHNQRPWRLLQDRGMERAPESSQIAGSECYQSVRPHRRADSALAISDAIDGGQRLGPLSCVLRHASVLERMLLPTLLLPAATPRPAAEPRVFVELLESEGGPSVTQALEHCFGWRGVRLTPSSAGNSTLSHLVDTYRLGATLDFVAMHTQDAPRRFDLGTAEPAIGVEVVLVDWRFGRRGSRGPLWSRCAACNVLNHTKLMLDRRLITKPLAGDSSQHPGRYSVYTTVRRCYATKGTGGQRSVISCYHKACVFGNKDQCASFCHLGDACASL